MRSISISHPVSVYVVSKLRIYWSCPPCKPNQENKLPILRKSDIVQCNFTQTRIINKISNCHSWGAPLPSLNTARRWQEYNQGKVAMFTAFILTGILWHHPHHNHAAVGGGGQLALIIHYIKQNAGYGVVLQKVPSEANPKVRNHGEGPY